MVKFWYKLVKSGAKTLDEVPEKWRDAVAEMLADDCRANRLNDCIGNRRTYKAIDWRTDIKTHANELKHHLKS